MAWLAKWHREREGGKKKKNKIPPRLVKEIHMDVMKIG